MLKQKTVLKSNIPGLVEKGALAKVARRMNMTNATVSQLAGKNAIEVFNEDSEIRLGTLLKIATALNVQFVDLFDEIRFPYSSQDSK